jgi:hypothetical protein
MTFGVWSEALKRIGARTMASRRSAEPLDRHSVRSATTVKGYPMQPKTPHPHLESSSILLFLFFHPQYEAEPGGREISRFAQGEELAVILIISCKDLDYLLLYRHTRHPTFPYPMPHYFVPGTPLSVLGTPLFYTRHPTF